MDAETYPALTEHLNQDVVSWIDGFLNPEIFSLEQTEKLLPEMNFEQLQGPLEDRRIALFYFEHEDVVPLPQEKLLTVHVTGNDREYLFKHSFSVFLIPTMDVWI